MNRKLLLILCLTALLALALPALGETITPEEYDGPEWTFPLSLKKLMASKLDIISPAVPADHTYKPTDLVTVRSRRNDDLGKNANGGVYLAGSGNVQLSECCSVAYFSMVEAAERSGITLYLRQGYRSYADQQKRYDRAVKSGSTENVQKAGESDYQTGLALTVVGIDYRGATLDEGYLRTPEYAWLAENAASYGFVVRYPEGKEAITGFAYEPWHLRYVGQSVATYMNNNNLCLEEFYDLLGQACVAFVQAGGDIQLAASISYPDGPVVLNTETADGDFEFILFHD